MDFEFDDLLQLTNKIGSETIDLDDTYNIIKNPKPLVESTNSFSDYGIDVNTWIITDDECKLNDIGLGSRAPIIESINKDRPPIIEEKTANKPEEKNISSVIKKVDPVSIKKVDNKIVEEIVNNNIEIKDEPKVISGKTFNSKAETKSNIMAKDAEENKHFSNSCNKNAKMFTDFIKTLIVDSESKAVVESVLKNFSTDTYGKLDSEITELNKKI
jgi:hypothetical protein